MLKTVQGQGSATEIIEKSKFIAYVRPAQTREEAEGFFAEIREKHRDATHNVPAMVLGERMQIQWGSDDGEPGGTAGTPIVQMIAKEGITNVAVVVTRYFGGIKLGPGGLVRAYTGCCKKGLEAAGICALTEMTILDMEVEYSYLAKLQSLEKGSSLEEGGFCIEDTAFTDKVQMKLSFLPEHEEKILGMLSNLTGGSFREISKETKMYKMPLKNR